MAYDGSFSFCNGSNNSKSTLHLFPPLKAPLSRFTLYECHKAFYLVGSDENRIVYKLLTIERTVGSQLVCREDPADYTRGQMQRRLYDIEVHKI